MALVRVPGFGRHGVVHDTVAEALPSGVWSDALNVRFTGVEMQKMLEPSLFVDWTLDDRPVWFQQWADGLSTYMAVATAGGLWLYQDNNLGQKAWVNASRDAPYNTDGYWDSFAWGDTCIFNNGLDAPQIFNQNTAKFEDLPNWGLLSTADDIFNNRPPTRKVQASCVRLVPFKSFLVAVGVTESGRYQPNKVWWSDSTNFAGYYGAPSWDYESPATLSGQIVIDPEGGAIRTAAVLNEQLIIYTDAGATAQLVVGGSLVMQFRRLFKKGAAGLHAVTEFNNQHFVVSQDQIYIHDGSTVVGNLIAKDRVEDEFFRRLGKGGRFGDPKDVVWDGIQVAKNSDRKEIVVAYNDPTDTLANDAPGLCVPAVITQEPVDAQPSGTGTVTFFVATSGTGPISYQWYENGVLMPGETSALLDVPDSSTSSYYAVATNPCGTDTSTSASVTGECVPVAIVVQPEEQVPGGSGTVEFFVGLAGSSPFNVQWDQDNAGDNVFSPMAGETDQTLTVPDTSVNQYRVRVSNACGAEQTSTTVSVVNFVCSAYTDELGVQGFAQLPLYSIGDESEDPWIYADTMATVRNSDGPNGDGVKFGWWTFWVSGANLMTDWTGTFDKTINFAGTIYDKLTQLRFCDGPVLRCVRIYHADSVEAMTVPTQLAGGNIHEDYTVSMVITQPQRSSSYRWTDVLLKGSNRRYGWDDDSGPVSGGSASTFVELSASGPVENRKVTLTVGQDTFDTDVPISEQNSLLIEIGDFRNEWIMITATVTSIEPEIRQRPVTTNRNYGYIESTLSVTVTRMDGSTSSGSVTGGSAFTGSSAGEDVVSIYPRTHDQYTTAHLFPGKTGDFWVSFVAYKRGIAADLAALSQAFFNNLDN